MSSKEVARIRALEKQICADPKQANDILVLKERLVGGKNEVRLASLHALRRIFLSFTESGRLTIAEDDKQSKLDSYKLWLQQQLQSYQECLCECIQQGDVVVMAPAIRTMVETVRREWLVRREAVGTADVRKARFGIRAYSMLLHALLRSSLDLDVDALLLLRTEVFAAPDCAYYAWVLVKRALRDCKRAAAAQGTKASKESKESKERTHLLRNALDLLRMLELPDEDEEPLVDPKQHLRVFGKAADSDESGAEQEDDDDEEEEEEEEGEEGEGSEDDSSNEGSDVEENLRQVVGKRAKKSPSAGKAATAHVRVTSSALRPKAQKKAFSEAWLVLLSLPLSGNQHKLVLKHLPDHVMPHLVNPLLLADFLYRGYEKGGVLAVLALQSLFTLIVQFNLDYPNFFTSLYDLCTTEVFTAKYRASFLPLLHAALKSTNIPSYTIAAFVKRLMQLALLVPSPCASFCIMQATWLLRQHKECHTLLHRAEGAAAVDSSKSKGIKRQRGVANGDVEVYSTEMPSQLQGGTDLESSLWEATGLRHHYLHSSATFSKALESARSTSVGKDAPYINVPDYLEHTYEQLIELELSRVKKAGGCPTAFAKPVKLMADDEALVGLFGWKA